MDAADEIDRKLPVWHALSELFLDTELEDRDYRAIAARLDGTGFTTTELRTILNRDVTPAFAPNLLATAGEWTPWGAEQVREIVIESRRSPRLVRWLFARMVRRSVAGDWARIEALLRG